MIINAIQEPKDMIKILKMVDKSFKEKNHLYLVYDPTSQTIGVSKDKAFASPLSLIQQSLKQSHRGLSSHPALRNITNHYFSKNQGFFAFLFRLCFPSKRKEYAKMLMIPSENCVAFKSDQFLGEKNYGVRKTAYSATGEKSLTYEQFAKLKLMQQEMQEEIPQLEKARRMHLEINRNDWLRAFEIDFSRHFQMAWQEDRLAVLAVKEAVQVVLDDWIKKLENGQGRIRVERFPKSVVYKINQMNETSLELDKSTFRDLVGKKVHDGIGKPLDTLPLGHDIIKDLIEDYNTDKWEQEFYTLIYDKIPDEKMRNKVNLALDTIFKPEGAAIHTLATLFRALKNDMERDT